MAVSGQKRKAIGEPCMLRLETSGSNAATAFSEIQAQQKRQRSDQETLAGSHDYQQNLQAQSFLTPLQGTTRHSVDGILPRSSSRNEGSSLSGYGTAIDVGGSPQISTATARQRGWPAEYAPAGSFVSSDSHQQSSVGDQHEVAMQAETPHSQAQGALAHLAFQPPGLVRSNSEPSLRLMLASPLNALPQQLFQQPLPTYGGSSTAGALVPYKAPELMISRNARAGQHALLKKSRVPPVVLKVIEDAFRSAQLRELHRVLSHLQSRQAAPCGAEHGSESAARESGPEKEGQVAMEVDEA